jgi:hypothetical protein
MNKLTVLCALIMMIGAVYGGHCDVDSSNQFWIIGVYPEGPDKYTLYAAIDLIRPLKSLEAATIICAQTGKNFKVKAGAKAFGFQVWCGATKCTSNYQLGASYFASTIKSTNPDIWAGNGFDLSHTNRGVYQPYEFMDASTHYVLNGAQFAQSNFPSEPSDKYYVCYTNLLENFYQSNLLSDIVLDSCWERLEIQVQF